MAAELKASLAADKQRQLELREAAKRDHEEQLRLQKESIEVREATTKGKKVADRPATVPEEEEVKAVVQATSRGRLVHRPKRFDF